MFSVFQINPNVKPEAKFTHALFGIERKDKSPGSAMPSLAKEGMDGDNPRRLRTAPPSCAKGAWERREGAWGKRNPVAVLLRTGDPTWSQSNHPVATRHPSFEGNYPLRGAPPLRGVSPPNQRYRIKS